MRVAVEKKSGWEGTANRFEAFRIQTIGLLFAERGYETVFDLAVTERCRRKDIGETLYQAAAAFFAEHGAAE